MDEKKTFDNLENFIKHLKIEGKEEIDIGIIKCVLKYEMGISVTEATEHIADILRGIDRAIITNKLTILIGDEYIKVEHNSYKFNSEKYVIKNISYFVKREIEDCGVATSYTTRENLEKIMKEKQSCVYLFVAITSADCFVGFLRERIANGYKTVVFFPHKKSVDMNANDSYEKSLSTWLEYLRDNKIRKFLQFYLINNEKYKYLYSSCLTENIVRFNYFEYSKDKKIITGEGQVYAGKKETSFYDMILKGYEQAFYEATPIFKHSYIEWTLSFIKRHLTKITIFLCFVIVLFAFLFEYATVSLIFSLIVMVFGFLREGFLQDKINNFLKIEPLKF